MKFRFFLILLLLSAFQTLQANQEAVILRPAPLHAEANSSSSRIAQIGAGTRVNLLQRQGGWKQIYLKDKKLKGWVRSYQVRQEITTSASEAKTQEESGGFFSGLAKLSRKASSLFKSGGESTSSRTATIGVRGLSESDISSATADFDQLEKMKSYSSHVERMPVFSGRGGLKARKIEDFGER